MKRSYTIDGLKAKLFYTGLFPSIEDLCNMSLSYNDICARKTIKTVHMYNANFKSKHADKIVNVLNDWIDGKIDYSEITDKYCK